MENIDLVYSFFNQYMFGGVKQNIDLIETYFESNSATQGNTLIHELLESIRRYPFEAIDVPLFQSILLRTGKNAKESEMILNEIMKWKNYSSIQIEPARNFFNQVCAAEVIRRGNHMYSDNPQEFIEYIKKSQYNSSFNPGGTMTSTIYKDFDKTLFSKTSRFKKYNTCYPWLNEAFPDGQISGGQLVMIAATPGTGKSLMVSALALHHAYMGAKTHVAFFGDISQDSQAYYRFGTIYSRLSWTESAQRQEEIFDQISKSPIGPNLGVTVSSAGEFSIEEYVDFILNSDYEICFLDYDANLSKKGLIGSDGGLYAYFEHIYEALTKITATGRLVYVCSQIKSGNLRDRVLDESAISGSRRKFEMVDIAITLTKNRDEGCTNSDLRVIKIIKNRNGRCGRIAYSLLLCNGNIVEIPKEVYDTLSRMEQRDYTDGDLNFLIAEQAKIQQQVNAQLAQQPRMDISGQPMIEKRNPVNNPFAGKRK